jgi:hypothetical protein
VRKESWSDAEATLRECVAIRAKIDPGAWSTAEAKFALGSALVRQKKYTEAEPLLVEGYRGMTRRADARGADVPPSAVRRKCLTDTLEGLIQLYDDWAKPDEAAKWRVELAAQKTNLPASFWWNYTYQPDPGRRVWSREGPTTYVERFPSGKVQKFNRVAAGTVDATEGVIFQLENSSTQAFVPYLGQRIMALKMRGNQKDSWRQLGEMKDFE